MGLFLLGWAKNTYIMCVYINIYIHLVAKKESNKKNNELEMKLVQ